MKRTPIQTDFTTIPSRFHSLLEGTAVYDSSCSEAARVYYLDRDGGLFLKSAPRGTLESEAQMTAYFHSLGLGAEVLAYTSCNRDWLLTRAVPGEDCTDERYLADPKRLSEQMAGLLWQLHHREAKDCPVKAHSGGYLALARHNYETGAYRRDLFPDNWGYDSAEEAIAVIQEMGHLLKNDTLIHGDYCLPNVMMDNWRFTGFIDVGNGGLGDKHVDLFWGSWSMGFNTGDPRWGQRFLDAYGRENYDPEILRLIAACEVFG